MCATTGWHRSHARKALAQSLRPKVVRPRKPRAPTYGPEVIAALRFCWAVLGSPAGKRLAAVLPELVAALRRFGELDITDDLERALLAMSAATIDRRLAGDRASMQLRGRCHTKPGSLLKSQIPIRTWAQWDDAVPGFVEIDLVGHEGGNAVGDAAMGSHEELPMPTGARQSAQIFSHSAASSRLTRSAGRRSFPEQTHAGQPR